MNAISRKGNSQTGVTEADRQKCWAHHVAITEECKVKLAEHNARLAAIANAAEAKLIKLDAESMDGPGIDGLGKDGLGLDFGVGLDVDNAAPESVYGDTFASLMANWVC